MHYFFIVLLAASFSSGESFGEYATSKNLAIPHFTNLTKNKDYAWLEEALADMLTTDIAATRKIRVVGRLEIQKILSEQKFQLSGLVDDIAAVKIGNMAGAGIILTGSFSIISNMLRIDAKLFDVEKALSLGAATIEGSLEKIFLLEKKLALKIFEALNIRLDEEATIALLQVESDNSDAIAYNYQGILALQEKKPQSAKQLFEKAILVDPFYRTAKQNFDALVIEVKGNSLFQEALSVLDDKKRQQEALERIISDFCESYYKITVKNKPEIITDANNPSKVTVRVWLTIDINRASITPFIERLKSISRGDMMVKLPINKHQTEQIPLFKENWLNIKQGWYQVTESEYLSFIMQKRLQLTSPQRTIAVKNLWIGLLYEHWARASYFSEPFIVVDFARDLNSQLPRDLCYDFVEMNVNEIKEITAIELRPIK